MFLEIFLIIASLLVSTCAVDCREGYISDKLSTGWHRKTRP